MFFTRWSSSFSIVGLQTGRPGFDPWQKQSIFPLASVSRPALTPTQPSIQRIPGVLSLGVKRERGVKLTTSPHLVKGKAVPLHAMEALGGRGGIAPTHS
jgi:hypothetical protein